MLKIGLIKSIYVSLKSDDEDSVYEVAFDIIAFDEHPRLLRLPYYPKSDEAKTTLYKSELDQEFICNIEQDSEGVWKILNVYQNIEVLK